MDVVVGNGMHEDREEKLKLSTDGGGMTSNNPGRARKGWTQASFMNLPMDIFELVRRLF